VSERYRLDTTKMSLRECLSYGPFSAAALLVCKVLRINLADAKPVAADIREFSVVPLEELPPCVSERFREVQRQSESLGAVFCFSYQYEALENILYGLDFVSPDRSFSLEHIWAQDEKRDTVTSIFVSPRAEVGDVATTNQKRVFDPERDDLVKFVPGASLDKLLAIHLRRIQSIPVRTVPVDVKEIRDWILGRERKAFQEFVRRGLFVAIPAVPLPLEFS
jgi:hypothetical protein